MKVTAEYTAQVRTAVGVNSESLDVPDGINVNQLVTALCDKHGDAIRSVLCGEDGTVHPSLLLFVGEQQVQPDTALADGQTVTFLSPISGG